MQEMQEMHEMHEMQEMHEMHEMHEMSSSISMRVTHICDPADASATAMLYDTRMLCHLIRHRTLAFTIAY